MKSLDELSVAFRDSHEFFKHFPPLGGWVGKTRAVTEACFPMERVKAMAHILLLLIYFTDFSIFSLFTFYFTSILCGPANSHSR